MDQSRAFQLARRRFNPFRGGFVAACKILDVLD
jgi:hypothetical protein